MAHTPQFEEARFNYVFNMRQMFGKPVEHWQQQFDAMPPEVQVSWTDDEINRSEGSIREDAHDLSRLG